MLPAVVVLDVDGALVDVVVEVPCDDGALEPLEHAASPVAPAMANAMSPIRMIESYRGRSGKVVIAHGGAEGHIQRDRGAPTAHASPGSLDRS